MNLQKMLKQAQEMQQKLAEQQAKMESQTFEGVAGGGMAKVTVTGKGQAVKVLLDPSLLVPDDKEMLEDLIVAAFNDARAKVDSATGDALSSLTAGLPMPPGFKMPF